jgi:hypothetical protein
MIRSPTRPSHASAPAVTVPGFSRDDLLAAVESLAPRFRAPSDTIEAARSLSRTPRLVAVKPDRGTEEFIGEFS